METRNVLKGEDWKSDGGKEIELCKIMRRKADLVRSFPRSVKEGACNVVTVSVGLPGWGACCDPLSDF